MRRLVVLTAAVFIAEAALYSAITPLLAHYAGTVGISKIGAGVLSATYAMGLIPGSLLAGWLSSRIGIRTVTIAGVAGFAGRSVSTRHWTQSLERPLMPEGPRCPDL